jgi:hypothetical protein
MHSLMSAKIRVTITTELISTYQPDMNVIGATFICEAI